MLRVKAECSERASHISRRRAAATKTKERDNNQLPMMFSEAYHMQRRS